MQEIDWDYWFRYRTLQDWEVVALSLGINPAIIDVNSVDGINYLYDEIIPKHRFEYQNRMRLLQDYRFISYSYFEEDDEPTNCFDAGDGKYKKILVKRFLLWLKNQDMRWELPQGFISYLHSPSNHDEMHEPKSVEGIMPPEKWNVLADMYASEMFKADSDITLDKISSLIAERFEKQGILSVRNAPIKFETVKRYISKEGFVRKRNIAKKK